MRKLLAISAALTLAFAVSGGAGARGPTSEFAFGSARTDTSVVTDLEHASFSAHSIAGPPGSCNATGHIVYKSGFYDFSADIVRLVVEEAPPTASAFLVGEVTRVAPGSGFVGEYAWFDAVDSRMPGGQGDQFLLESPEQESAPCFVPLAGHPITSGNIVIKTAAP
jgi:hypothetical protein